MLDFKIADISKDEKLVTYTRNLAIQVLDRDPDLSLPENRRLSEKVSQMISHDTNWSVIS